MKTTICNRIEYVLASEVHYFRLPDLIVLKPGRSFRSATASEKPEYAQEVSVTPSGTLSEETLTLSAERSLNAELLQKPYELYVLKVHASNGWFLMGTPDNPATLTCQLDASAATISFSCNRPLLNF
jgi:hypothetical protein